MRRAPSIRAAWMTFRPMPPQPITATSEPTSIRAVFMTAPKPVMTAQPTSAARSAGMSCAADQQLLLGHHGVLGEARDAAVVVDDVAVQPADARGAVEQRAVGVRAAVAQHRPADGAVVAAAAVGAQDEHAAVAGLHGGDAGADRLDDAAALVAEHDRERGGGVAEHPVQVGVADAGRLDLQPRTSPGPRVGELDLLDLERLVGREHDAARVRMERDATAPAPRAAP